MRSPAILRLLAATLLVTLSGLAPAAPQNRVVFHLSEGDPSIWKQAFNNVRNVQKSFSKGNIAIAMVINGNAIGAAKLESPVAESLSEAIASGIEIIACENTMRERNLRREDMH
jgi:hypothetical protein